MRTAHKSGYRDGAGRIRLQAAKIPAPTIDATPCEYIETLTLRYSPVFIFYCQSKMMTYYDLDSFVQFLVVVHVLSCKFGDDVKDES